ncbi:MAG: hypothetical protein IT454_08255 [Planctomycetes bacterium]|nr:hypothetical protein [Planctomycetota bacterium]
MHTRTGTRLASPARGGFALITVLLVLMALLVLCAPFLMTSRNASKAAAQISDRAQARLALDMAVRHARGSLGGSHPALDTTPYFDDAAELTELPELAKSFIDPRNDLGVMWQTEVADVAGRIDLNSAPPQLFANLLGATNRLAAAIKPEDKELSVSFASGFAPTGYLWIGRELIKYEELEGTTFKKLTRGVGAVTDDKGRAKEAGAVPPSSHPAGTTVIDQRAFAPAMWRAITRTGELREFDAPEQVRDAAQLAYGIVERPADGATAEAIKSFEESVSAFVEPFLATGTTYAGVRAGRAWHKPVRVLNAVVAGETGILRLDEVRWFSPGTTVQITDGATTELGIVQGLVDGGIRLMEPAKNEYFAYTAEVRALARRPVNVNMASADVLEALFANVQLAGSGDRITRDEARDLAALVVQSRPFLGLEDFLRRVVLPAAGLEKLPGDAPVAPASVASGSGFIDVRDAQALYRNALNANDSYLAYSTMPFSFTTRDVFEMNVRAVVNAQSGVERVSLVRDQVEMVVPQRDLMQVWARQEDFDEAFRLDREAPLWSTGPNALQRWDSGATPPSNYVPHFGTLDGQPFVPSITSQVASSNTSAGSQETPVPEHVFASREDAGWAQLWAAREPDSIQGLTQRHVMHFDHETQDPEGRYVASEYVQRSTNELDWTATQSPLLRAFSFSGWFKPRSLAPSNWVDIGRTSVETDRVQLAIGATNAGAELVLHVYDAAGDHPDSAFREVSEVHFAVTPGQAPGLLADTWSHVSVDVRGSKPSQITMLVDGRTHGVRKFGLTRLTSTLAATSTTIAVDSVEGFPDPCVVKIGNELIECSVGPGNALTATPTLSGANAGFGGRQARVQWQGGEAGVPTTTNLDVTHESGTPVELYGYAAVLASNVPNGSAQLPSVLGKWGVAYATAVIGGASSAGDPISHSQILFPLGTGLDANSSANGLQLAACDAGITTAEMMKAFSPTGGYAVLIQLAAGTITQTNNGQPVASSTTHTTANGAPLFGAEVIRYSGWTNDVLNISARAALPAIDPQQVPHAFVVQWNPIWQSQALGVPLRDILRWQTFVIPISIPTPGVSPSGVGFLAPNNGSEFAQITHTTDAEKTEWVRYDTISGDGHLVRNNLLALTALKDTVTLGSTDIDVQGNAPPPGGGGPAIVGPAVIEPESGALDSRFVPLAFALATPPAPLRAPASARQGSGYLWQANWGVSELDTLPLTKAAATNFQFRGVCGTYTHEHTNGTTVVPVWRVQGNGVAGGEPGRFDYVMLMEEQNGSASSLGWPARVHRTYRPLDRTVTTWTFDPAAPLVPTADTSGTAIEDGFILARSAVMVALESAARAPVGLTPVGTSSTPNLDTRQLSRVLKFPSGERPREVDRAIVGRSLRNETPLEGVVDELVFHTTNFGEVSVPYSQAGQLILREDFPEGSQQLQVQPQSLRIAWGHYGELHDFVGDLPSDAGLLVIGDEILCYDSYDAATGVLNVPPGARGLLGSVEGNHEIGEAACFLQQLQVGILSSTIGPGDATLTLTDVTGFPPGGGTVLVGDELVHYTRVVGNALEMPRRSTKPGKKDHKGDGLFRARFGSDGAQHDAGTPVILFPFRYWDRWTEKADAPELAYYSLAVDQPNAFWRTAFWSAEEPSTGQVKIEALQRTVQRGVEAPPWDGEPGVTPGLTLLSEGMPRGAGNRIARQADLVEWRLHARFAQGAFDAQNGLSHGWKQTPRLRVFGTEYLGPNLVLRRVGQ